MYSRALELTAVKQMKKQRCLSLIGPRQSGKTTLCKNLFSDYRYFTFESPDIRSRFEYDPRGFLEGINDNAILDEVQRVPELLSYLQEILDDPADRRKFILTGSNNLLLSHKISQTLAGRTRILQLLPLQRSEIDPSDQKESIDETLLYGSYPRIYHEELNPTEWLGDYLQTYVEKDIRDTINIMNLRSFDAFLRLLAGRVGQLVNFNALAGEAGITQPTAKSWLSACETTYACFLLQPHFRNFNKRITKAPKIYFYDTGLLCYLLRIQNTDQLATHPLRGQIFENWVVSEYMKSFFNQGKEAPLYFWRDQHGHEVDLVLDRGKFLELIEIKSGATFQKEYLKNIQWLNKLQDREEATLIYGGSEAFTLGPTSVIPWNGIS